MLLRIIPVGAFLLLIITAFETQASAEPPAEKDPKAPTAEERTTPFRYCYYLFERPGKVEGGGDSYIPLLVAREALEKSNPPEVAVFTTYERDSIWKLADTLVKLDKDAVQPKERKIRFEGKVYRYQRIPNEEVVRLLEKPEGTIPVHRPARPINEKNEQLHSALLKDLSAQVAAEKRLGESAQELTSLIGKNWKEVWAALEPQGVKLVNERADKDGRAVYILGGKNDRSASFTFRATNGRIDEVEAWSPYELKTLFPRVIGAIAPGASVEAIEKEHGAPILVEHGLWGTGGGPLRMKGWLVGDYLVFVTNASGQRLGPEVERVTAFRKDILPKDRRLFTNAKVTLAGLARGEKHIEPPPKKRE